MSYAEGIDPRIISSESRTSRPMLPHDESNALPLEQESQGFVVIGGCHGFLILPAEELADFYKGHGYVALAGLVWLGIVELVRLVS